MRRIRWVSLTGAVVLAPALLLASGVAFGDGGLAGPLAQQAPSPALVTSADDLEVMQQRLQRLPDDYAGWSALGFAYVARARSSADATYYPKAQDAFARSLMVWPKDNVDAVAGQGALANARHEFTRGRALARQAVRIDPYSSTAWGVLSDALLELGRYDQGLVALQRMVDLRPGVPSLTRIGHSFELRGDRTGARVAYERALAVATAPSDKSYVLFYLAELAFNAGSYPAAAAHLDEGIRIDPGYVPLLALRARVSAAQGATKSALADYAAVVARLPQPTYLIEYGELLDSLGRTESAQAQYRVAAAVETLFSAAAVVPDIEIALFEADHGRCTQALAIAQRQYRSRRSVGVEDALAWALHNCGRDAQALPHAIAAAQLGTKNALWDYHRGMIQQALGMHNAARASLTAALRTNPGFSPRHAPLARAELAQLR